MFCSKCGSRLSGGSNFCHSCGAKTAQVNNPVPDINVYPLPTQAYPGQDVPDIIFPQAPIFPDIHEPSEAPNLPVPPFTAENTAVTEGVAPEAASLFPENEPVAEPQTASFSTPLPELRAAESDNAFDNIEENDFQAEPAPFLKPEKAYFGKPALIFCLVVIGILSVTCGVFATLYFGGF
ncbi:MAG: zinc ribbon domain-containing protein [Oscillospiraceae bacterium]|nr:zinc ribbon domain-containing protein [Oscillospiraceae bacterium]